MNVGEAYFSKDMRLNHAAVNPVFSLLESYSKQEDFAHQYRFMSEKEAAEVVRPMLLYEERQCNGIVKCQAS